MSLYNELKRRNVFRVVIAYLAGAWLLTEVAGTLFPAFGVPDWAVRFVVIVLALGFLPALIISWAYELTPEGLKREKDEVRDTSITHVTAKRLDWITIGLIAAALAFILTDRLWLSPRFAQQISAPVESVTENGQTSEPDSQYPPNSIAVLPFVNMSDDAGNEYFADGISEELLNLLAKIPEMKVIARTSSFSYKGKDTKIADIARELDVGHVLEGSVRKSGNQVRITAQLIEAVSGTHLWSETYDRTLEDIFSLQNEIASRVVDALRITLLGEAVPTKARETDPEAFTLYLQGRHIAQNASSAEEYGKAEEYLRQSLEKDPDYAPTWERLATIKINLALRGMVDFNESYELAREFTKNALELDPNLASAHSGLGWIAMMYDRNLPTAAAHFRRALALAPNDVAILAIDSVFAETLGRLEQSIELGERALDISPLADVTFGNLAIVHCYLGQFTLATAKFRKALELNPDSQFLLPWLAKCHLLKGEPEKALSVARKIAVESRRLWIMPMAYHDLGQKQAADEALGTLKENHADEAASFIAENHAWRGETDKAFEWLDRAIDEKQYMWGSLVFDPAFRNLHDDPRWATIRERDGRSEEQLSKIEF